MYGSWVIGTALQNNPKSQQSFLAHNGLEALIECLKAEKKEENGKKGSLEAKVKCLYAISSAIKHHPESLEKFIQLKGLEILLDDLATTLKKQGKGDGGEKVIRRHLYILHGICLSDAKTLASNKAESSLVPILCDLLVTVDDIEAIEKSLEIMLILESDFSSDLKHDIIASKTLTTLLCRKEIINDLSPDVVESIKKAFI